MSETENLSESGAQTQGRVLRLHQRTQDQVSVLYTLRA